MINHCARLCRCDEILLAVCRHKLPGSIEAANIDTSNWTHHNERATNDFITIFAFGMQSVISSVFWTCNCSVYVEVINRLFNPNLSLQLARRYELYVLATRNILYLQISSPFCKILLVLQNIFYPWWCRSSASSGIERDRRLRDLFLIRFNFYISLKASLETIIPLGFFLSTSRTFWLRKSFLLILRHLQ